jgi:acetyltransferase-like isoleucine patch superfamily enzyme
MEQIYHAPWEFKAYGKGVNIFEYCVILKPGMISIGDKARIDSHCKIEGGQGVTIGPGCHISSFVHLNVGGGELIIGDNTAITSGACIISGSNTAEGEAMSSAAPPEMQVVKRTTVRIGKCAMVAAHAVVLPGVTIGDYAVLAAGAVATKDIPAYEIWAGIPARKIGMRAPVIR